ncbi:MAG: (Fe-S)-binding protein [Bacteroidetes bacterium HGW-Bacteroidetes-4]|nr:MAG: (Fe-S)-binding protein [Bacteroidetes bacterium HGW-Bacteroidetes-4]
MYYDPFVLPFTLGLLLLLGYLLVKYGTWFWQLDAQDKKKIRYRLLTRRTLIALREIVAEGLIHRKIFKVNPRLGYMHMSLAFGWFLLIVVGAIEAHIFVKGSAPLYFPIFFRYFVPDQHHFFFSWGFAQLMDLLLLFVLSGLFMAFAKRFNAKTVGLKKTTKLKVVDKFVLTALWLIFPLRLLAESLTSGYHNSGGFLTGSLGAVFQYLFPTEPFIYPAWWAYSLSLGVFFVGLPFTRYMHIPTEMVLIFFRNWGLKLKVNNPVLKAVEIYSCPKCGICIDTCQLNELQNTTKSQSVYFIQRVRNAENYRELAENCLLCGRCESVCPVGIDLTALRLMHKTDFSENKKDQFAFVSERTNTADVIYFAGCMTHLTPTIKNSMEQIFKQAGENYWFMDKEQGACCGRPLKLAGQFQAASELVSLNRNMILQSGAHTLVTSCPICYKIFKEDYRLPLRVLHHSEYINELLVSKKIQVKKSTISVVYHDPCELGRGAAVYQAPRNALQFASNVIENGSSGQNSLCCGGSLANQSLSENNKQNIAHTTVHKLTDNNPELIATACPMCKKTLGAVSAVKVVDIAELVAKQMIVKPVHQKQKAVSVAEFA